MLKWNKKDNIEITVEDVKSRIRKMILRTVVDVKSRIRKMILR